MTTTRCCCIIKTAYMRLLFKILLLLSLTISLDAHGQVTNFGSNREKFNVDSVVREFNSRPSFGLYKDNYFTIGTALNAHPNEYNSDVKFQISFSQRLTKAELPFQSYLFLFYSQKAMWNVFEESLPFRDLNFNPGIGLSKLIIRNGRFMGKVTFMFEHESNGRDGEASRSWNKITHNISLYLDPRFMVHWKVWIPIVDGRQNKDILKYNGIFQTGAQYVSPNRRWVIDATFIKRKGWDMSFNSTINVGLRLNPRANQFLMLHFYDGYGENMLDYNKYHCRLRIGILIRPELFSDF